MLSLYKPNKILLLISFLILFLAVILSYFLYQHFFQTESLLGSCKNCNIVIIDIDMLRSDALGCNEAKENSPNICKFSENSFNFTNNVSHSDLTLPSLVSGLTSLYPSSHNMWTEFDMGLDKRILTLPMILNENNYQTVFIGDAKHKHIVTDGFTEVVEVKSLLRSEFDLMTIVRNLSQDRSPFLLYIHSFDLHLPYLPPDYAQPIDKSQAPEGIPTTWKEHEESMAEYLASHYNELFTPEAIALNSELFQQNQIENNEKILDLFEKYDYATVPIRTRFLNDSWRAYKESYMRYIDENNPKHRTYLKSNYLELVRLLDTEIAGLINLLSSPQLVGNTIVIIKSDHGEEFFEHGRVGHSNNLYQELIHTPLLVKIPYSKSRKIHDFSQDIDIMPTLLDLVGIESPSQTQGMSLVPLMENSKDFINTYQISQKGYQDTTTFIKGDWKLIMNNYTPFELYNLSQDPSEKKNIISKNKKRALELFGEYSQIIDGHKKYGPEFNSAEDLKEERRERLIEEGYF